LRTLSNTSPALHTPSSHSTECNQPARLDDEVRQGGSIDMSVNQVPGRRVKAAAAAAGGVAVVAMGLIGVIGSGAPDARASMGTPPSPMVVGETTTITTPAKDMPAKAVPVVKAARYGKS
jgi:hypothetical protein